MKNTLFLLFPFLILNQLHADKSPGLQVLDRFLGTWDSVVTNTMTGEVSKTTESRTWSKKGNFVISQDWNHTDSTEAIFLMTYDPGQKKYRTCFMSQFDTVPIYGIWDQATQTMLWEGITSWGAKFSGVDRFVDTDHRQWEGTFTDSQGKEVIKLSAKQTRRK